MDDLYISHNYIEYKFMKILNILLASYFEYILYEMEVMEGIGCEINIKISFNNILKLFSSRRVMLLIKAYLKRNKKFYRDIE